jgi:hypothetical protein
VRFVDGGVFLGPLKVADVSLLARSCVITDRHCGMIPAYRRDDEDVALTEA